jgi:hypothetical protein
VTELLDALADPTTRRLLLALRDEPVAYSDLVGDHRQPRRSSRARALQRLGAMGLLSRTERGDYTTIAPDRFACLIADLVDIAAMAAAVRQQMVSVDQQYFTELRSALSKPEQPPTADGKDGSAARIGDS